MISKFKVGEIVEQNTDQLNEGQNPLCKIIGFSKSIKGITLVRHIHLGDVRMYTAGIRTFKKVPKLKRILLGSKI